MAYEFILKYIKELEHFAIAAIFGVLNLLLKPVHSSPWYYVVEFIVSVTVATLVGIVSVDLGFSNAMGFSLTAVAALLSRDILNIIVGFGDYLSNNKQILLARLFDKLFNILGNSIEKKLDNTDLENTDKKE